MGFFSKPFALLWKHRLLLVQTTWRDLRSRYIGSVLGFAWLFLYPLLFLGTYALMYVFVFRIRFADYSSMDYIAHIFCGLIPFLGFSESIGTGVRSITDNPNLIKNTLFPIEMIPVKAVLVSQTTQFVGTGLLLILLAILGRLSKWALLLPVIWFFQLLFTTGLVWFLSSLNVILRDIQNTISVAMMILMMVSPIAYTTDMLPDNLRHLLGLNPLFYFIISYQRTLMSGEAPGGTVFGIVIILGLGVFFLGFSFFMRMKTVFVDSV